MNRVRGRRRVMQVRPAHARKNGEGWAPAFVPCVRPLHRVFKGGIDEANERFHRRVVEGLEGIPEVENYSLAPSIHCFQFSSFLHPSPII